MRILLNNNITQRLFSSTNTKKIISCISCKNYNIVNQTCKRFVDIDNATENITYHSVKNVRNDDNKCGLEKMIGYEPILNDLLNEHKKITQKYNTYLTFMNVSILSSISFSCFIFLIGFGKISLGCCISSIISSLLKQSTVELVTHSSLLT